jgi:hypothetical protein
MLPDDINAALRRAMQNPAAATCSDRDLMLALARYDAVDSGLVFVESLAVGTIFRTDGGRMFCLGPKLRSRFRSLVADYAGADLNDYNLRRIGSELEGEIRTLLQAGEIRYNPDSRVLNYSMGLPRTPEAL